MYINADYSKRVVMNHHDLFWVPSPESGVERRMLERTGDEAQFAGPEAWRQTRFDFEDSSYTQRLFAMGQGEMEFASARVLGATG